jgi:hypothetical protein
MVIAKATTLSGIFDTNPDGGGGTIHLPNGTTFTEAGFTWGIWYFNNKVVLTPEPNSLALLATAAGLAGIGWWRTRRKLKLNRSLPS